MADDETKWLLRVKLAVKVDVMNVMKRECQLKRKLHFLVSQQQQVTNNIDDSLISFRIAFAFDQAKINSWDRAANRHNHVEKEIIVRITWHSFE